VDEKKQGDKQYLGDQAAGEVDASQGCMARKAMQAKAMPAEPCAEATLPPAGGDAK